MELDSVLSNMNIDQFVVNHLRLFLVLTLPTVLLLLSLCFVLRIFSFLSGGDEIVSVKNKRSKASFSH